MKRFIEVKVVRNERRLSFVKCDLCGDNATYEDNWNNEYQGINETKIQNKEGHNYTDGGGYVKTSFDLCPTCFKEKLVPWMREQGSEPTTEEVDY